MCSASVVLPQLSGPYISTMRPRGDAAYAEREVEREGARRYGLDVHGYVVAQAHYRAFAEVLLYLRYRRLKGLALVLRRRRRSRRGLLFISHNLHLVN